MNHIPFIIVSVVSFCMVFTFSSLYIGNNSNLKPLPLSILILHVFAYFVIYKTHYYALLIEAGFVFCLVGDIMLMFYDPKNNNHVYLIASGASFMIARLLMSLAFLVFPYKKSPEKCVDVSVKKVGLVFIPIFVYSFGAGTFFCFSVGGIVGFFLFLYFIIVGVQMFFAFLRVGGFKGESFLAQSLGVLGTLLFTISDTLLFFGMFIAETKHGNSVSILLYWSGMYCIAISVVRNTYHDLEKAGLFGYFPESVDY